MRAIFNLVAAAATAAAFVATVSLPATAACKRYGFTVNDYGKDGPTKDAKALLDKMIASKMSEQGIKDFHTGKKSVSCELFLNFIVFDEHTCTAEATVCWGGSQLPKSEETAAADDTAAEPKKASSDAAEPKTAKKKDVAKKSELVAEKKKTAALKTIADPKKPTVSAEHTSAAPEAPESAAATPAASESSSTEAKPETHATKPVETGSLNEPAKKPVKHHAEKTAPETNDGPPVKLDNGAGYPTPEGPQDDAQ
ncbi:hypothetical protein HYPDE_27828 [Hyphomicrobium denitrificans 1NES1]|uniref:Uncharacterized protein n=1 Tax=Hyphomicrobium denitrificans 1NES1 TaxID=670307 RepID=N0BAU3_9HYPH|nr:hypothetical protein [Hyphomicrobium denitrificans]AGK57245.1 hypothetical protein HYPDE_27828 [Hyphomicrobium denitrificans 1NES1]